MYKNSVRIKPRTIAYLQWTFPHHCILSLLPQPDSPLAVPLPPDPDAATSPAFLELGLTLATQFGFMIESCILAARQSEDMICPAHRDRPLKLRDLAPDVVSVYACTCIFVLE